VANEALACKPSDGRGGSAPTASPGGMRVDAATHVTTNRVWYTMKPLAFDAGLVMRRLPDQSASHPIGIRQYTARSLRVVSLVVRTARARCTIRRLGASAMLLAAAVAHGREPEALDPRAREALALCQAADEAALSERSNVLARGVERAEKAVTARPNDAVAHFALFCNLGKQLQMEPRRWVPWAVLGELRRARREIDAALELKPDYSGALAAKGEMLAEQPPRLGGDRQEAERLMRRAVALDPDDPQVRIMLAKLLWSIGKCDEAQMQTALAVGNVRIAPTGR